jgi:hypothetical protein
MRKSIVQHEILSTPIGNQSYFSMSHDQFITPSPASWSRIFYLKTPKHFLKKNAMFVNKTYNIM